MQWQPGKTSIFGFDKDYDEADLDAPVFDQEDVKGEEESKGEPKKEEVEDNCFIGLGNNEKLAKEALMNHGFKTMNRGMQFSNKYRLKWTQTSSEI